MRVQSVFFRRQVWAAPHADIHGGIWRALVMAVEDGVPLRLRRAFESEVVMMPRYVPEIRNWALSPVIWSSGVRRWSYVWEQDFDDVAGLLGGYRMHPIHFGLIDWFQADHPERIIDSRLLRVVCDSPPGVIDPPDARRD